MIEWLRNRFWIKKEFSQTFVITEECFTHHQDNCYDNFICNAIKFGPDYAHRYMIWGHAHSYTDMKTSNGLYEDSDGNGARRSSQGFPGTEKIEWTNREWWNIIRVYRAPLLPHVEKALAAYKKDRGRPDFKKFTLNVQMCQTFMPDWNRKFKV